MWCRRWITLALAKAGATMGLFGRTRETLEKTSAAIAELGGRSVICVGDTGVRADVERAVEEVQAQLGPIWALVNNAYSAERTLAADITDDILDGALRGCIHGSLYYVGLLSDHEATWRPHHQFRLWGCHDWPSRS